MFFASTVKMKHNTDGDQKSNTCKKYKYSNCFCRLQARNSNSPYQMSFISLVATLKKLVVYQFNILSLINFIFIMSHPGSVRQYNDIV